MTLGDPSQATLKRGVKGERGTDSEERGTNSEEGLVKGGGENTMGWVRRVERRRHHCSTSARPILV